MFLLDHGKVERQLFQSRSLRFIASLGSRSTQQKQIWVSSIENPASYPNWIEEKYASQEMPKSTNEHRVTRYQRSLRLQASEARFPMMLAATYCKKVQIPKRFQECPFWTKTQKVVDSSNHLYFITSSRFWMILIISSEAWRVTMHAKDRNSQKCTVLFAERFFCSVMLLQYLFFETFSVQNVLDVMLFGFLFSKTWNAFGSGCASGLLFASCYPAVSEYSISSHSSSVCCVSPAIKQRLLVFSNLLAQLFLRAICLAGSS